MPKILSRFFLGAASSLLNQPNTNRAKPDARVKCFRYVTVLRKTRRASPTLNGRADAVIDGVALDGFEPGIPDQCDQLIL